VLNESENSGPTILVTRVLDGRGVEVAKVESNHTIQSRGVYDFTQTLDVKAPQLWSPETPALYTAISEVSVDGRAVDHAETRFGIRTLTFDVAQGFLLNGKPLKLKGGCLHHDNGPLGARAFDRAEERRVELLKASGFNALRLAHNPPSPAFLEACDRLGMMVIDEAFDMWRKERTHMTTTVFDDWWQRTSKA
jgi:beta-galactosidase